MTTTTNPAPRPGAIVPQDIPDPRPIPPPKPNKSRPAPPPRLAPDEDFDTPPPAPAAETNGAAPAVAKKKPTITISTTVQHRGRTFTIQASDIKLDAFCDLLDEAGYAAPESPQQWQTLPDGTPICPKHHAPMRLREKQGDSWYSHNVGTKETPIYCKGYHGKDSPGYER